MRSWTAALGGLVTATTVIAAVPPVGAAPQEDVTPPVTARRVEPFPHLDEVRITPVPIHQITPLQRLLLGPGEGTIQVRLCISNPQLCRAYWGLVSANVIRNITIPVRDHELLVLRTAWLTRQRAIWGNHMNCCALAQAELTLEEIEWLTEGPEAPGWNDADRSTLRAADELHMYRFITDPTWQALAQRFDDGQLIEILMTVGNYTNVNMYFNTFGIQPGRGEMGIPAAFYRDIPTAPNLSVPARRVAPFTRLEDLRIKPNAFLAPGEGPLQVRLCLSVLQLCRAYWDLVQQNTVKNITIPLRDHELLVLRTAWLLRGHTIWGNHVNCCAERQAGLTQEEIARITEGPNAPGWSDSDAAILRAADELHTYRLIQEATWKKLARRFNHGQLFEVVMTVGNYTSVIGYFNSVGIPPSNGEKGIPANFYQADTQ